MSEKESKPSPEVEKAEAAKIRVETERIQYELEQKKLIQPQEKQINLKKLEVQLQKLKHEEKRAKYEAGIAELSYNINKREEDKLLSSDRYNKIYRFVNAVSDASVADCMMVLSRWSRLDPSCDMEIVFCSPGGSIIDGFALFDFIQDLKKRGHKVTTKSIGYAASMAGVLLQAGSERVMGREAWMLIHEASFLAMGKMGEVTDTVEWVKRLCERITNIFADKAATKTGKSPKAIKAFIKKNWTRKDWWISAEEALEYGFCDRVD